MVYARPWFYDDVNHVNRIPLDMPVEDYERLPSALRRLLTRAYFYAVRSRWYELEAGALTGAQARPVASRSVGAPAAAPALMRG